MTKWQTWTKGLYGYAGVSTRRRFGRKLCITEYTRGPTRRTLVKNFTKMLRGNLSADSLPPHFQGMNVRFKLMKSNRWLGLAALAASVQFLSAADIVGKVTLKGNPPAERVTPMADGFCGPGSKATQL